MGAARSLGRANHPWRSEGASTLLAVAYINHPLRRQAVERADRLPIVAVFRIVIVFDDEAVPHLGPGQEGSPPRGAEHSPGGILVRRRHQHRLEVLHCSKPTDLDSFVINRHRHQLDPRRRKVGALLRMPRILDREFANSPRSQDLPHLPEAGRVAMVQSYHAKVETAGESSLVFIAGRFSHAMRKGPALDGPDRGIDRRFALGGGVDLRPRQPSAGELELAERVLDLVPGGRDGLLYARVDLVPSDEEEPLVMEVELTEPNLFLDRAPHALNRLVNAIAGRVSSLPAAASLAAP